MTKHRLFLLWLVFLLCIVVEVLKQAVRIKPDDAGTHYSLGLTYLILGDTGSAFREYKILKDLDEEKANELFNLIYR